MLFFQKLKTSSLFRLLINNLFLITISLVLVLLSLNNILFIILFIPYLFFIYRKNRYLFYIMISLSIILFILYFIRKEIIYDKNMTSFKGTVVDVIKKEYYNRILLKKGIYKIYVYDYDFLDIKIGDIISVQGESREISGPRIPNSFDYQKYYYSNSIVSIIKANTIDIKRSFNLYYFRRWITGYIDNTFDEKSKSFIMGMVLGNQNYFEEKTKDAISINNISHLFAISGLHINIIVSILEKGLKRFIKKDNYIENIIIVFLIIYLLITNFQVSITRAVLMYIFLVISKRFSLSLSSLDIASFVFILMILFNPFYMYHLGFILSFSACFVIIIFSSTIKELNFSPKLNNMKEIIIITLLLQLATFPIITNLNHSFNILSFITNFIFIELVSLIILPATFLVLILPFLKNIYHYLIESFDYLNIFCSEILKIKIDIPSFSPFEIFLYYLFLIIFIIIFKKLNKKRMIIFISSFFLFFIIHLIKIDLNLNGKIYFLDLYEGDATIIDLPLNKGVVMIDTGIESNDVISFLKSIGVRKIDYLFLTHNHADHTGNAKKIVEEFIVRNIIVSIYHEARYGINNTYVKGGDILKLNNYEFKIISPSKVGKDENDNSLVIYTKLGNMKYLFLGDVSKDVEEEVAFLNIDVDVVKVAHHGSSTSTSPLLYDKIKPTYVIIETGRKERFSFPNKEVVKYLEKFNLFRTDSDYTVIISFNNRNTKIRKTKKGF